MSCMPPTHCTFDWFLPMNFNFLTLQLQYVLNNHVLQLTWLYIVVVFPYVSISLVAFRFSPTTFCPRTSSKVPWATVGSWQPWQRWQKILISFTACLVSKDPRWTSMASMKLGVKVCCPWRMMNYQCVVLFIYILHMETWNLTGMLLMKTEYLLHISGVEVIYSCLLAFWGIGLFRPTHLVWSKDLPAHDLLMTKEIKCFKNGRPTSIILDDFLPCSPNTGMPCYAHVDVQGQFVGMKWAFWVRNASLKDCCSPVVRMEWMSGIDWQIFPNAQYNQLLYCIWDSLKIITKLVPKILITSPSCDCKGPSRADLFQN